MARQDTRSSPFVNVRCNERMDGLLLMLTVYSMLKNNLELNVERDGL